MARKFPVHPLKWLCFPKLSRGSLCRKINELLLCCTRKTIACDISVLETFWFIVSVSHEGSELDQTTRLPGISLLSREGIAVVASAGTDRLSRNQLRATAERRWLMPLP